MRAFASRRYTLPAAFLLLVPTAAFAAWPTDPTVNLPVCTATQHQYAPVSVSDGAGGAIVAWNTDAFQRRRHDTHSFSTTPGSGTPTRGGTWR